MTPCRIRVDYRQSLQDRHVPKLAQLVEQIEAERGVLKVFVDVDGSSFRNLSDEHGSPTTLVEIVVFDPLNKEQGFSPGDFSKLPIVTPRHEDNRWIFETHFVAVNLDGTVIDRAVQGINRG